MASNGVPLLAGPPPQEAIVKITKEPIDIPTTVTASAWIDPVVEAHGHDPRSLYVEACWGGILGPTALLTYRRLGPLVIASPEGSPVDLVDLAVGLGVEGGVGRNSLMARALGRLVVFGAARWAGSELQVRRALADVPVARTRTMSRTALAIHERHRAACPA
jgi:hypothetical protein